MKSLPLSSVEEMLLNHKQLFQPQLGCVRLGNLKMLGRRRGDVPAQPLPVPASCPKLRRPKHPARSPAGPWGDGTHTWPPSRFGSGHFKRGEGKTHPGQMRSPRRGWDTPDWENPLLFNTHGTWGPGQRVFLAKTGKAGTPGDPWIPHQRLRCHPAQWPWDGPLPALPPAQPATHSKCHPCHKMGTVPCLWRCLFAKPGGTLGPGLGVTCWSQRAEIKGGSTAVGVDTW